MAAAAMTRECGPCRRLLAGLVAFHREHQYGPSHLEMADMVGVSSTSSVAYHVAHLLEDGLVRVDRDRARSARPTAEGLRVSEAIG